MYRTYRCSVRVASMCPCKGTAQIFNEIVKTLLWPLKWKTDYVTIIPKKSKPQEIGDLRNISCTKLFSKIMESFVLEWTSQVQPIWRHQGLQRHTHAYQGVAENIGQSGR